MKNTTIILFLIVAASCKPNRIEQIEINTTQPDTTILDPCRQLLNRADLHYTLGIMAANRADSLENTNLPYAIEDAKSLRQQSKECIVLGDKFKFQYDSCRLKP